MASAAAATACVLKTEVQVRDKLAERVFLLDSMSLTSSFVFEKKKEENRGDCREKLIACQDKRRKEINARQKFHAHTWMAMRNVF